MIVTSVPTTPVDGEKDETTGIADRARAARIVRRHAADGGAARGRDIDRKEQAVRLEGGIQAIEHQAGFDRYQAGFRVEPDDPVHVFGSIDHQGLADGLAALRGAAAPRQHGDPFRAGDLQRRPDVGAVARHHHADRLDLIDRRVGGIAAAREPVEQHLALDRAVQAARERAIADLRAGGPVGGRVGGPVGGPVGGGGGRRELGQGEPRRAARAIRA